MPATELRQRPASFLCGMANWHPEWMQRFATMKMFMAIYGLLGTIQAMSYMYFIVTLTTIEKRFKIPSQTTGIILSGNEISQILLSLILSYVGGQRNRPRWIAWGVVFCGISCFVLALPHFIYGAGDEILQLTQEYYDDLKNTGNGTNAAPLVNTSLKNNQQLCGSIKYSHECEALLSILPLALIFLSQFILGIGNTLYYSLGQTYLDDNTKKTNTPLMLAVAMSLRMIGPIVGFLFGYISLNMFIDPTKTPLIDNKDPRWLGAWWFGWIILGTLMVLFSGLIGLFPKELPKRKRTHYNSHLPQVLRHDELKVDEGLPLGSSFSSNATLDTMTVGATDFPQLKDFPKALMRLLRNKLLMFNISSAIFYILGATAYMTYLTKYMEVQFHKNAQSATIVVGPVSIIGMIIGLIGSGVVISKNKPSASKVLLWNVVVGCMYICGQVSYLFMFCGDSDAMLVDGKLNITAQCNSNCSCDGVPYSPLCHEPTETTYFSPCHAGCHSWDPKEKIYSNCACLTKDISITLNTHSSTPNVFKELFSDVDDLETTLKPSLIYTNIPITATPHDASPRGILVETATEGVISRSRRLAEDFVNVLKPGVCTKGCNIAFWSFSIASMIVNWFGSSGRVGNMLVNYRAVSKEDKSFAQGLLIMLISLFALIPGPIIFGRLIDSTCLVWSQTCNGNGNCQLYDQTKFRYLVNLSACTLTSLGMLFDILVWYYGRNLDLYGEKEAHRMEESRKRNKPITPLLSKKEVN